MPRITPYQRLLDEIIAWCHKLRFRHTVTMCRFPKKELSDSWRLDDIYERVAAAEQLGYEVYLRASDDGLVVEYRKKLPEIPYRWR